MTGVHHPGTRPTFYRWLWMRAVQSRGEQHPATRAIHGRYLAFPEVGYVPQRGSVTIEHVAWYRASGAIPGYHNRHMRCHRRQEGATYAPT